MRGRRSKKPIRRRHGWRSTCRRLSTCQFANRSPAQLTSDRMVIHRVRDADPAIRTDCLKELGVWVKKYPEKYIATTYLTYFSRGCNDPVSSLDHKLSRADSSRTRMPASRPSKPFIISLPKTLSLTMPGPSPYASLLASLRWLYAMWIYPCGSQPCLSSLS